MSENQVDYCAYLLRLCRDDDRNTWYATLQNPHSGEQLKFTNLDQLWKFIQEQTQSTPETQQ